MHVQIWHVKSCIFSTLSSSLSFTRPLIHPEGLQYRSETGVDPEHQGSDSGENDSPEGGAKGAHTPSQNPSQTAQYQQKVFHLIHLKDRFFFLHCSGSSLICIKRINASVLPKCTAPITELSARCFTIDCVCDCSGN